MVGVYQGSSGYPLVVLWGFSKYSPGVLQGISRVPRLVVVIGTETVVVYRICERVIDLVAVVWYTKILGSW